MMGPLYSSGRGAHPRDKTLGHVRQVHLVCSKSIRARCSFGQLRSQNSLLFTTLDWCCWKTYGKKPTWFQHGVSVPATRKEWIQASTKNDFHNHALNTKKTQHGHDIFLYLWPQVTVGRRHNSDGSQPPTKKTKMDRPSATQEISTHLHLRRQHEVNSERREETHRERYVEKKTCTQTDRTHPDKTRPDWA